MKAWAWTLFCVVPGLAGCTWFDASQCAVAEITVVEDALVGDGEIICTGEPPFASIAATLLCPDGATSPYYYVVDTSGDPPYDVTVWSAAGRVVHDNTGEFPVPAGRAAYLYIVQPSPTMEYLQFRMFCNGYE